MAISLSSDTKENINSLQEPQDQAVSTRKIPRNAKWLSGDDATLLDSLKTFADGNSADNGTFKSAIMHNTSTAVSPFYDQEPGAPPPFPPMLTNQLELFSSPCCSTVLIADEILLPKPKNILAPEFKLTTRPSKNTNHLFSLYLKSGSLERSHSRTPIPSDSSTSFDSLSDSDSSTSASLSEDSKIPKPPGEPGRPGRGGYTLCKALDWSPKAYSKFKNSMHHLIEEHLNTSKCASSQSPILLKTMRNKAVDAFPNLENYSEFWPVNDMIMMRLKYTSGHARQKETRMAMGKSKRHTPKKI
ncbi:hypothetical protein BD769DRAFT_1679124 [Suillus cothurnatus]|nr:hypothetical protein BD769DRAFT_1679124 [Suillus cothurnatus]